MMVLILITVLITSCKDEIWDSHFSDKMETRSDKTIMEYLNSRSDLSIFDQMLKVTGYDSLLTKSQTFTVWAPLDSSLAKVDMNNLAEVTKIVKNHVAYFSFPTSVVASKPKMMLMQDNKFLVFSGSSTASKLDSKTIVDSDIAMKNGIVHVLSSYVPYKKNFYEFISETSGLDSIKAYMKSLDRRILDKDKSYQNNVFKDSVFKITNYLMDTVAAIDTEDSIYTAILPTNTAWGNAYNSMIPYFKTLTKDGGVKKQVSDVKRAIVSNLFFRGTKTLPLSPDSLTTTMNTTFYQADRLFSGAQSNELSNGWAYVTNQLNDKPSDSWLKPIVIEAENYAYYGGVTANYTASVTSSVGSQMPVSRKSYLYLLDATVNSNQPFINFKIPGNYATKYNVYCVFVPGSIVDPNDQKAFKVKFGISYYNSAGILSSVYVDENNSPTTKSLSQATFITDPTKVQKMLVLKNFELPYRYVYPSSIQSIADYQKSISLTLKITNAALKTQYDILNYNRNIRIDCIILEPVQ
jgi:hypothetical protein